MRKACCNSQGRNKGAWSKQEDQKLIDYIRTHGEGCWRSLPQSAGLLRCGRSCRLRWINYLRPDIKRGNIAEDEEDLIIKLHALLGNRWSLIAGRLPGRTDNEVKNYWNSHLRRKLQSKGIDPNNHRLKPNLPCDGNQQVTGTTTLFGSNRPACGMTKSFNYNDQVSDAASCVDEETCRLPDLNLDLTVAIPSPSITLCEESKPHRDSSTTRELESSTPRTLLLFV